MVLPKTRSNSNTKPRTNEGAGVNHFRVREAMNLWQQTLGHLAEAPVGQRREDSESTNPPIAPREPIEMLGGYYEFGDYATVTRFLRENPSLIGLLIEAHNRIEEYFGPDASVVLRVVKDPEALEDERLFTSVRTELSPKEALARLAELDREWWLKRLSGSQYKLTLDLEYV